MSLDVTNQFRVFESTVSEAVSPVYNFSKCEFGAIQFAPGSPANAITIEISQDYRTDTDTGTWLALGSAVSTASIVEIPDYVRFVRLKRAANTNVMKAIISGKSVKNT